MKGIVVIVLLIAVGIWLRAKCQRLVAPVRAKEVALHKHILQALSDTSIFIGHPAQLLFDALGPETSSISGDFGLVSYIWRADDLCIYADVKNAVCQSIERYEEMPSRDA